MTAMDRFYWLNSESSKLANFDEHELGVGFMHLSIDKHKRGNCVFDT